MTNIAKRTALTAVAALTLLAVPAGAPARTDAEGIDPRSGGFQVSLGEWAIGLEARAVRPGPITIVVANRGKLEHGLELERIRGENEDSEDDHETEDLAPGRTGRITVNLRPGVYRLECSVSNHDERGMTIRLEVRADAPLVKPATNSADNVVIRNFAYAPRTLNVKAGTTVKWRNADAAPHTVTAGSTGSDVLNRGGTYSRKFTRRGTWAYICALHPAMKGTVVVK